MTTRRNLSISTTAFLTLTAIILPAGLNNQSYAQEQSHCPFYMPNCELSNTTRIDEETTQSEMTAILTIATIAIEPSSAHFDIITAKLRDSPAQISESVFSAIDDIERNEVSLFIVDRVHRETVALSDIDEFEQAIDARLQALASEEARLATGSNNTLVLSENMSRIVGINILQLVNGTSQNTDGFPSSITVDIRLLNASQPNPAGAMARIDPIEYPSYTACLMGVLVSNSMNPGGIAGRVQEICLK